MFTLMFALFLLCTRIFHVIFPPHYFRLPELSQFSCCFLANLRRVSRAEEKKLTQLSMILYIFIRRMCLSVRIWLISFITFTLSSMFCENILWGKWELCELTRAWLGTGAKQVESYAVTHVTAKRWVEFLQLFEWFQILHAISTPLRPFTHANVLTFVSVLSHTQEHRCYRVGSHNYFEHIISSLYVSEKLSFSLFTFTLLSFISSHHSSR